jgi:hypothetical protein
VRNGERIAFESFLRKHNRQKKQTNAPIARVLIILHLYFALGGSTAKPAVAKAQSTHTTEIAKRKEAQMTVCLTDLTTVPMKAFSRLGIAAFAPVKTVAMAKKKERLLKNQNA